MHNLLFCAHTLCMNYVTNTFVLVSFLVQSKQLLCFVQREQKHTTKKFVEFHNQSPILTMLRLRAHYLTPFQAVRFFFININFCHITVTSLAKTQHLIKRKTSLHGGTVKISPPNSANSAQFVPEMADARIRRI